MPLAVCEAIEAVAPVACRIKWPNDVWLEARKVAGVLIEARPPGWAVIGIGLNVAIADDEFPADLRWPATSIGHGVEVGTVRAAGSGRSARWVEAPERRVLAAFADRDALAGAKVEWEGGRPTPAEASRPGSTSAATCRRVDGGGRLSLGSGEVQLRLG